MIVQRDLFSPVDPVGIHDNIALLRLAKDSLQLHHREFPRDKQISQHLSRTHTGQLIHIPHQNQTCAGGDRFQQRLEQHHVHHGHLIDNDDVRLQRIGLISLKAYFPGIIVRERTVQLQHTMNGSGLIPCGLCHSLGRPAGGCCQKNIQPSGLEISDHHIDGRGLAGAGPSGQKKYAIGDTVQHCLKLQFIQFHVQLSGKLLQLFSNGVLHGGKLFCQTHIQIQQHPGTV